MMAPAALATASPVAPATLPLRTEVARQLPGIKFGLVAVLERGDRRAAVTWPAIRDGKIFDDDIIGWVFVRDGAGWLPDNVVGLSHGHGREQLENALGGAPEHIISRCGIGTKELAAHLARWPRAFADARARGDDDAAIHAYEELARAFSLEAAAYDDMLPEMLIASAEGKPQISWTCDGERPRYGLLPVAALRRRVGVAAARTVRARLQRGPLTRRAFGSSASPPFGSEAKILVGVLPRSRDNQDGEASLNRT